MILAIAIVLTVGPLVGILSSKAKFLVRFNDHFFDKHPTVISIRREAFIQQTDNT